MANENQPLAPPQVIHALMTIIREMREQFGTKLKIKQKSPIMRLLGIILFFNKNFMDSFITVLGKTIYFPSNWETIIKICDDHLESGADDSEFPIVHTPEARRLFAILCHESHPFSSMRSPPQPTGDPTSRQEGMQQMLY